ncbi:MAG TPA: malate synthase A [Kofleriaceae bacterium]|nr:malate synthase A [Kofleriaceae bacterium]
MPEIHISSAGDDAPAALPKVLTPDALAFLVELETKFGPQRARLLELRRKRDAEIASGKAYGLLDETKDVRAADWKVAAAPRDLDRRHVEITGPVEIKMLINALNSGADVFMADFEDSLAPTWDNVINGQANLYEAVRRTLAFTSPEGKAYKLGPKLATLVVRPRGWHLAEKHASLDNTPLSASLFDAGLYLFHNAKELIARGSGPYFYLPKMESHLEARLWNDVFVHAQEVLGIPRGTIRATVLVETLPAAFEMEEILYELREHASGLNAGRWDYLFSAIKKLRDRPGLAIPDRSQLVMTVPFMRAYTERLVRTCHKRGAHAMGGMSPFIPSRKDPQINAAALAKVREDKQREVRDGFDGTWVAHPDLVPVAAEVFGGALGDRANQKDKLREDVKVSDPQLLDLGVPEGKITEAGVRNNVSVALQYISAWLSGNGAVAIFNLMEDAATAEISRAQLWFWVHHGGKLDDGRAVNIELYQAIRDEETAKLADAPTAEYLAAAVPLLDGLVIGDQFVDFLTLPAYEALD